MLLYLVTPNGIKVLTASNQDMSIKELYDIVKHNNISKLYYRDILLNPDNKIVDYFPYGIHHIYLYTQPQSLIEKKGYKNIINLYIPLIYLVTIITVGYLTNFFSN